MNDECDRPNDRSTLHHIEFLEGIQKTLNDITRSLGLYVIDPRIDGRLASLRERISWEIRELRKEVAGDEGQ